MKIKWNKKLHSATVEKHPELEGKTDSVALAVYALEQNKDMTADDWRDVSESSGLRVAGRAVGSARAILGMAPATKKKVGNKRGPKRGPGRPRGSKNVVRRSSSSAGASDSLGDVVAMIRDLEKQRDQYQNVLTKVRDLLDSAL